MRPVTLLAAPLLAAALAMPFTSSARADIVLNIDKSTQHMTVSVDGTTRYVWPVSTGRRGYDTPNGTFKPFRMEADHFSKEWDDAPMPHSIFFTKIGHAIHGSLEVRRLGTAASHGCVRLSPANASTLWNLVKAEGMKDTTVVISGSIPSGQNPEVARRRAPREETAAAVPMHIAPDYEEQPQPYYRQQQTYYRQPQPYYGQQQFYYVQPAYGQPQYYVLQPYNQY